jgi:cell division protein FtsL
MSRRRFIALWLAAVVSTTMAFVVHLAVRHENVLLGIDVSAKRAEQRHLLEARRALEIEAETLRDPARVERIAREILEMETASAARIVPIGRSLPADRRTAGRIR